MTLDDAKVDEGTEVSGDDGCPPVRSQGRWVRFGRWRWRWLAWLLLAITVIIAASASILLTLANDYRPLTYGLDGTGGLAYPGLRAGHGIRVVNNIGHFREGPLAHQAYCRPSAFCIT